MLEAQLRIFGGDLGHVRAVVAERGREDEARAVEIDHGFHGLLDRIRFRDLLFLDHLDAGESLEGYRALGMGLIVTVVVARTDIDEADGGVLGGGRAGRQHARERQCGGPLQNAPT